MKTQGEMQQMSMWARINSGWNEDGSRRAIKDDLEPDAGVDEYETAAEDRVYAEGVEAGILWAMGCAGSPFPR